MDRKLSQLDIAPTDFQTNTNFSKTNSLITPSSSIKAQRPKFDSPKMFQRKPSFKGFQRKEKKCQGPNPKITYISPQKSQIFKKYSNYGDSRIDLNTSMVTDNSSDVFGKDQSKKSFKPFSLFLDLNQSRSILNQINNFKPENGFMTPKNSRNQFSWTSPSCLKKATIKKLKSQEENIANSETSFNNDFNTLHQLKEPIFEAYKTSRLPYCQSQRRISKNGSNQRKENNGLGVYCQNLPFESRIKTINHEIEIEKLKLQCTKLRTQKNQVEDSSRIFLDQIKQLQLKLEKETEEKDKATRQSNELKEQLSQKERQIAILSGQIKNLQAINQEKKSNDFQQNEHYKAMYFQLSQKLKYLTVENDILKKILEERKEDGFKIDRLQTLNKKLTARNKFLAKALQQMDVQAKETKRQNTAKKVGSLMNLQNNKFNQLKSIRDFKTPSKRNPLLAQECGFHSLLESIPKISEDSQEDKFSIVSNGSSLELSFELSPQKNHWPRSNEESLARQFKTTRTIKRSKHFLP